MSSNDWIQTSHGGWFNLLEPRAEDVDVCDVATSLATKCRYGGHVRAPSRFLSVAEHCYLLAQFARQQLGRTPAECLKVLLHDAPEAYYGDIVRPLKKVLRRTCPELFVLMDRIDDVVMRALGSDPEIPDWIHELDLAVCEDERRACMAEPEHDWYTGSEPPHPLGVTVMCWEPALARSRYLDLYWRLRRAG